MLMVLSQGTGRHDISVRACLAWVDIHDTDDTCGSCLDANAAGKIELVREDVFVVGQGDDELDDKLTVANDDSAVCAPVCVFP